MPDVIGGSSANSNSEISSLSEVSGDALTEEQLRGLINEIDVTLYNIQHGNGTYGGANYEERGNVGFKVETSNQVRNLLEMRKQYVDALRDPAQLNDYELLGSQWDNPAI